jgi:hypothetical protein
MRNLRGEEEETLSCLRGGEFVRMGSFGECPISFLKEAQDEDL